MRLRGQRHGLLAEGDNHSTVSTRQANIVKTYVAKQISSYHRETTVGRYSLGGPEPSICVYRMRPCIPMSGAAIRASPDVTP
jgi:hypothetical protein